MSGMIRIGRGGAGNFMSQKDMEEAEKQQGANDPEAQKLSSLSSAAEAPPPPEAAQTAAHVPQYVRSGRGGAGNFVEPPTVADAQAGQDVVERTKAAVSASHAGKPRTGLVGRGGAGNWTEDSEATTADDGTAGAEEVNEEKARRQQIAAQIAHDIDASLPAPPKTYHQHDRDME